MESSMTTRTAPRDAAQPRPPSPSPEQEGEQTEAERIEARIAEAEAHNARTVGSPDVTIKQTVVPGIGGPEGVERELSKGQRAIEQAAQGATHAKGLTDEERMDALAYLLQDEPDQEVLPTQTFELNVGTDTQPVYIDWTIRPLGDEEMTQLAQRARQEAGMNRQARRQGLEPEIDANLMWCRQIAVATVEPDLMRAAEVKGVASADPLFGPVMLIRKRFGHKPGIIQQLAGRIANFSGWDEADVVRKTPEMQMVQATRFS